MMLAADMIENERRIIATERWRQKKKSMLLECHHRKSSIVVHSNGGQMPSEQSDEAFRARFDQVLFDPHRKQVKAKAKRNNFFFYWQSKLNVTTQIGCCGCTSCSTRRIRRSQSAARSNSLARSGMLLCLSRVGFMDVNLVLFFCWQANRQRSSRLNTRVSTVQGGYAQVTITKINQYCLHLKKT